MSTLTETAYYTRRGLKIVFFVVLGLIFFKIATTGLSTLFNTYRFGPGGGPAVPTPTPGVGFGKLPAIQFPPGKAPIQPMTYTQEFIGGAIPEASSSARVYFVAKPAPNFLSLERSKEFAQSLGFPVEPVALSKTLYQWTDPEYHLRTLKKDILTGNFSLYLDFYKDPSPLAENELPYGKTAVSEALGFLGRYGLPVPEMAEDGSGAKVSFWRSTGSELLPVSSVSEADITRVDLFRAPQDNFPLVTAFSEEAPIYFLFSGSGGKTRVLLWRYVFRIVEGGIFTTYPLKTTKQAWEELEDGKGYIANWGAVKGTHATIRKVYLAYFDSETYQSYLMPVFVFEGDGGFMVYVSAVANEWVE